MSEKKEVYGITKDQMQEFYDDAFDRGFMEAAAQIKKAIFGAKNMARAKLRISRIENAVVISMNERKEKRANGKSGNNSEGSSGAERGLSGETAQVASESEGVAQGAQSVESASKEASSGSSNESQISTN